MCATRCRLEWSTPGPRSTGEEPSVTLSAITFTRSSTHVTTGGNQGPFEVIRHRPLDHRGSVVVDKHDLLRSDNGRWLLCVRAAQLWEAASLEKGLCQASLLVQERLQSGRILRHLPRLPRMERCGSWPSRRVSTGSSRGSREDDQRWRDAGQNAPLRAVHLCGRDRRCRDQLITVRSPCHRERRRFAVRHCQQGRLPSSRAERSSAVRRGLDKQRGGNGSGTPSRATGPGRCFVPARTPRSSFDIIRACWRRKCR